MEHAAIIKDGVIVHTHAGRPEQRINNYFSKEHITIPSMPSLSLNYSCNITYANREALSSDVVEHIIPAEPVVWYAHSDVLNGSML